MKSRQRKKYFVDPKVQGALLARVVGYWVASLAAVFLLLAIIPMILCSIAVDSPPSFGQILRETWANLWPAFMASLIVLPFIMGDCLRLSNRFAGPMFRLRKAMRRLADGEQVEPIRFRDNDFWFEFTQDFNRLAEQRSPASAEQKPTELEDVPESELTPAAVSSVRDTTREESESPISA